MVLLVVRECSYPLAFLLRQSSIPVEDTLHNGYARKALEIEKR
jgi:hypothetical protein